MKEPPPTIEFTLNGETLTGIADDELDFDKIFTPNVLSNGNVEMLALTPDGGHYRLELKAGSPSAESIKKRIAKGITINFEITFAEGDDDNGAGN